MDINFVKQENSEFLNEFEFDYIICASGFETRSTNIFSKIDKKKNSNSERICFAFGDRKLFSKYDNDIFFENNNFLFIEANSNDIIEYTDIFHKIFVKSNKSCIKILLDYSCMTSIIYASILKYFKDFSGNFEEVNIIFGYSQAVFTEPIKNKSLFFNQPIPLFDPIQSTDKKIALLIGLGYEEDKALGLYEYFQNNSNDIYLFITGKSSSEAFFEKVTNNNEKLIKTTKKDNIIYYDINNLTPLISTLDSLVNYLLSTNYRVVIAPIGPKVFSLCSMLINLNHKEVTTYRLSDGNKGKAIDKVFDESKQIIFINVSLIKTQIFN